MDTIILLTGCINPNGMSFTQLTDVNERQKQYVNAIHYYIKETDCKIIFCENSNTNINYLFDNYSERLEILTFNGNKDKQRGKGYGEAEIIEYAFQKSKWLKENKIVIKITGRLIVNNIKHITKSRKSKKEFITCLFHSDLKFADSRIICATSSFYKEFYSKRNMINDSCGVYFEHILCSTVLESPLSFIPFSEEPLITGISGSTGKSYHIQPSSFKHKLLFKCYSSIQLLKILEKSKNRKHKISNKILILLKIAIYKTLIKIIKLSRAFFRHI